MILDTSGLLAAFLPDQRHHEACAEALRSDPVRVVSPYVLAELDYLALTRGGVAAELDVLSELTSGAYHLAPFDNDDVVRAAEIIERSGDHGLGIADASIVVLADRHQTHRVLTLDQRHFRAIAAMDGRPFELVPLDWAGDRSDG